MNHIFAYKGNDNDGAIISAIDPGNFRKGKKIGQIFGQDASEVTYIGSVFNHSYHPQAIGRLGKDGYYWHATHLGPSIWPYGLSISMDSGKLKGYKWDDMLQPGDIVVPLKDGFNNSKTRVTKPMLDLAKKNIEQSLDNSIKSRQMHVVY